jgi:DHA1 family bicyclomycin/chloramphenicol resistance-like MFS transporter
VVRDLYQPVDAARAMSKGLSGLGVIACASAPLGGLLSDLFGWRATLLGVAVFGAATLALIALRFEETVPPANRRALHPVSLAKTWGHILRHPTFLAFSALSAASYGGLFTFLATSSFVFIKVLGLSKTRYGLLMFSMSLSYIVGTFICRRLLLSLGVRRTVALAGVLTITGGTLMAVLAMVGSTSAWYGPWAIVGPFYLFMLGHGAHQPCGQSGAIGPFPQAAGTASALNGFLMMVAAFAMGGWLGAHMDGTVFPMVYGIWFWSVLITLSAWTLVQRHGHTPRH